MSKKLHSSLFKVLYNSIIQTFIFTGLYLYLTSLLKKPINWILLFIVIILSFFFFVYLNYVTVSVNDKEIRFHKLNGKSKFIPMDAAYISYAVVRRRFDYPKFASEYYITYKINENERHDKRMVCTSFSKKNFEIIVSEIYLQRYKSAKTNTEIKLDTNFVINQLVSLDPNYMHEYKLEKEQIITDLKHRKKILSISFILLLISTIICSIILYSSLNLEFNKLIFNLFAFIILFTCTNINFVLLIYSLIQHRLFNYRIPDTIFMDSTHLNIDNSTFDLAKIKNLKITVTQSTKTARIIKFIYEGKKFTYRLDGNNTNSVFPEYRLFCDQLNKYFVNQNQFIYIL